MTQEPTPTPDDEIAVIARALCDLPDTCTLHREKAARIHAALKSAGYELVNQVGTVHHEPDSWQHIVGGPSSAPTATDNQVINPSTVELTARWIGERESTHTWPEIREDDKACYRDAARHLLDTLSGRGVIWDRFPGLNDSPGVRIKYAGQNAGIAAAGALEAMAPGATAAARIGMQIANRAAGIAGQEAANNWLTRMLANTNTVCVQLPEPNEGNDDDGRFVATWSLGEGETVQVDVFKHVLLDGIDYSVAEARYLAAALLAAAAKAEASE